MKYTINNQLALTPYNHGQGLKSSVKSGFAIVEQKIRAIPLTVLVDAKLSSGEVIPAGSTAFVLEETLKNEQSTLKIRTGTLFDGEYIVLDLRHILGFEINAQDKPLSKEES